MAKTPEAGKVFSPQASFDTFLPGGRVYCRAYGPSGQEVPDRRERLGKGDQCMGKRMMLMVVAVMLVTGMPLRAGAAEETGGIRVTMPSDGAGVLTLYQVGEKTEEGYRILESFGGGVVREEDAVSPHLAKLLVGMATEGGISLTMDKENSAEFNYLGRGLYLLVQSEAEAGASTIRPFLLTIPFEGQWFVHAYPDPKVYYTEIPATGQHPAPILGAIGMVATGIGLAVCVGKRRIKGILFIKHTFY